MSESDPLTDEYPDIVQKSAVKNLIEEKKVNGKLASGTYNKLLLSLKKIGLDLTKGALSRKVQCGFKNSPPVDEVDINPADSDTSHLEATNNIVIQENSNATLEDGNCSPSGSITMKTECFCLRPTDPRVVLWKRQEKTPKSTMIV